MQPCAVHLVRPNSVRDGGRGWEGREEKGIEGRVRWREARMEDGEEREWDGGRQGGRGRIKGEMEGGKEGGKGRGSQG